MRYIILAILVIFAVLACGCSGIISTPPPSKCFDGSGVITSKTIQTAGTSSTVWRLYFVTIDNTMYEVSANDYGEVHIGQNVNVSHCIDREDELTSIGVKK
jgi:hypothetical protein